MPNIDKKNEIIKSLWPITMKPDGTQRYSYKTGNEDKPVEEFLLQPCLKKCIRYRRSTGAFTRGAMITWADHLYRIIEEGVKIDILTHLQIDDDIIQALSILDKANATELIDCSIFWYIRSNERTYTLVDFCRASISRVLCATAIL